MGHLLPARRRAERRPEEAAEEAREGPREGAREGRRPAAEQASTPLGGVGERVGESTPINGAEGSRRGWPASLGWWGWPAAAATASALYAAYHLSVLLLFLPLPYAILGAPASLTRHPPHRAPLPSALSGHSSPGRQSCVRRRALRLRLRLLPPAPHAQARGAHLHPDARGRRRRDRLRARRLHLELPPAAEVIGGRGYSKILDLFVP